LGKILYHLFIFSYAIGARLISPWNAKAKQWLAGRKQFPQLPDNSRQCIWMHCASLGEFEQGRPLLEKIKTIYPNQKIVLTFFSPSGYEVMKNYAGVDHIFYLPMDGKANADKFIKAINPGLVLWVKYEYWFYYLTALKASNIPVLMVSGLFRESQPFFKWYGAIWRQMLGCYTQFFMQNQESVDLLKSLGFDQQLSITGDTRFDRVIEIAERFEPMPLIAAFCGNSKVIVAGSTWEDDEAELVHYVRQHPEIKFIIAPHEINAENLASVKKEFPQSIFYSELVNGSPQTVDDGRAKDEALHPDQTSDIKHQTSDINDHQSPNTLIIDNIGMLSRLYHYAHIAYVGGGFAEDGIHNVIEPAVHGKPVIFGPEYEKFAEAVELVELGVGISIGNALELEKVLDDLLRNLVTMQLKSSTARSYVYSKAGATQKVMDYIQEKRLLTNW